MMTHISWRIVPYSGDSSHKVVRVRDESRLQAVLRHLLALECVALLGPPMSEKTSLLQDIASYLRTSGRFKPLMIDLWRTRSNDEATFFASLAGLIAAELGRSPSGVASPRAFQNYLDDCLNGQPQHLALLIDHLQALPDDLIHSLLLALRAAYMERNAAAASQLVVVVAGSTNLAGLAIGPTSPFNIARPVVVSHLDDAQTRALAEANLAAFGCVASAAALEQIAAWSGGDHYLIPLLCRRCARAVQGYRDLRITRRVVTRVAEQMVNASGSQAPIRAGIRIIEEDPDTMLDVLDLLEQGSLPRARARQMITRTGTDRLQLSGTVLLQNGAYRFKNRAYQQALARHFTADRVGHVLRITGRWQEAIDYLAPHLAGPSRTEVRPQLLEAIVQSIYAIGAPARAFRLLAQGLELGFDLTGVAIYRANPAHARLELAYQQDAAASPAIINLLDEASVEAQTYRYGNYALRGSAEEARLIAALTVRQRPIGLVTVERYAEHRDPHDLPGELPDLLRFLSHAAGAIENVLVREAYQSIGKAVLSASSLQPTMHEVLETVAAALGADYAALFLVDQSHTGLEAAACIGCLRQVAMSKEGDLSLAGSHPAAECLRKARVLLVRGGLERLDPAVVEWAGPHGVARIFLPLSAAGHDLGALELGYVGAQGLALNDSTRNRFLAFADQAAIAVHNMQLLRRTDEALNLKVEEINLARQIQLSMLPEADPELSGWEFAAAHLAARIVSGDFYDHFELPGQPPRLGMLIADVADKGVPAALFMALSRTIIRTTAVSGRGPASMLLRANKLILKDSRSDLFLSAAYGILDLQSGRLIYANAGHNRPLWYHAATGEITELTAQGTVLGILEEIRIEEQRLDVAPGDVLLFYTDGVTEAVNSAMEEFGIERLRAALTSDAGMSARSLLRGILDSVAGFTGNTEQADDITCFAVKRLESAR